MTQSVSIIVPVLNEQESLIELIAEIDSVARSNEWTYETLVVDDGSADQTWKTLELLSPQYPHLAAARLNRNLGKSIALQTGIDRARYDFVVTIDGDLQDVPSEIPRLLEKLDEGFDVVSGWKKDRQDSSGKRFVSRVFNATVSFLTRVSLHDHNCGLKAYRKQVFESIQLSHGLHRFIPFLAARNGARVGEVIVKHRPRKHGRSRYGWGRYLEAMIDLFGIMVLRKGRKKVPHDKSTEQIAESFNWQLN
ncbi:MAG: glycosyltransferase family 2 protein [Pirellulaceae bacterium]